LSRTNGADDSLGLFTTLVWIVLSFLATVIREYVASKAFRHTGSLDFTANIGQILSFAILFLVESVTNWTIPLRLSNATGFVVDFDVCARFYRTGIVNISSFAKPVFIYIQTNASMSFKR